MRNKIQSNAFGAWSYLGPTILAALQHPPELSPDEVACLMTIALCPQALPASLSQPKAGCIAAVFVKLLSEKPDLTLRLLTIVREKWNSPLHRDIVQRFIATNIYLQRPIVEMVKRRVRGKWVNRPHWKQQGIIMTDPRATAGDIAQAIKANSGPTITTATVGKARQTMKRPRPLWVSSKMGHAITHLRNTGLDLGLGF